MPDGRLSRATSFAQRNQSVLFACGIGGSALAAQRFEPSDWQFWIFNGVALAFVVAQAWAGQTLVKNARTAQEEFKVVMYDQLGPLARQLSKMAAQPPDKRAAMRDETLQIGVECASGLAGLQVRTRATFFTRTPRRGGPVFEPRQTHGRGDKAQSTFRKGTAEGDAVWEYAERDQARFVVDVDADPPPGWDASRKREYRTFITVPVYSGERLIGLLTVNAPTPGDLTKDDVGTMQVLAGLLGTAHGMANGTANGK